jgi:iron complex outermembrane recepter protein
MASSKSFRESGIAVNGRIAAAASAANKASRATARSLSSVLALIAAPVWAQGEPAANSSESIGGLQEVVVTATRRAENQQEIPVAVTAVTADMLAKQGVFETTDLNRSMPNLQVSSPYGTAQPNFSLRGIGVGTEFNANAASPVGVYVDEVYQTFRSSHGQQLFDLERIEVVRGPQGTLYGRNTTGGAINFITQQPSLAGTDGYVTVGYGNFERKSFELAGEYTPITDVVGIRISGTYVESEPYIHNRLSNGIPDPGGDENYGFRGIVRLQPTEAIDISLKAYTSRSQGGVEYPFNTGPSLTDDTVDLRNSALGALYAALPSSLVAALPAPYSRSERGLDDREVEVDTGGGRVNETEGVVLTGKFELADQLQLISVSGYDSGLYKQKPNTDCDSTPYSVCAIGYESSFHAFNQDVRLDYSREGFNVIVGAYYGRDVLDADNRPDFFNFLTDLRIAAGLPSTYFNPAGALDPTGLPTGIRATQQYTQERKSTALYSEGKYDVTDTISATVGIRYTRDRFSYEDGIATYFDDAGNPRLVTVSNYTVNGVESAYLIGASPGTFGGLERHGESNEVSGRAILDWKPMDDVLVYASYSKGYRGGTFNGLAYGSAAQVYFVEPEKVDAYEVGLKSRFIDNRLQVNAAFFLYDYQGQQGQVVDQTATANLVSLDGEMRGLEIEAEFLATDSLRLSAAVGVLDSEYDHSPCPESPAISGFPPQNGNCVNTGAGNVDVGGNPFPFAAELSFNAGFDWDILETRLGTFALHGDASYTGQFYYDSFGKYDYVNGSVQSRNLAQGVFHEGEGEYWIGNARLSLNASKYSISFWVKNLTDHTYYPYGINLESLFGGSYRVRAQPRTYGAEATYRF